MFQLVVHINLVAVIFAVVDINLVAVFVAVVGN